MALGGRRVELFPIERVMESFGNFMDTPTKEIIFNKTKVDMTALGTYKAEFDAVIDIYSGIMAEYYLKLQEYEDGGRVSEMPTRDGSMKKSPIVTTLEALRKDVLSYSDRLCLNPKSLSNSDVPKEKGSKLDGIFGEINERETKRN